MRSSRPIQTAFSLSILGVVILLTSSLHAEKPDTSRVKKITSVEGITEYRLDNGLRILLFPDPSRSVVTVNLTIFVGSRHEGYGETGMAHLLEHMLFKGTPQHPDIPKVLRDHGARFNGTTWVDRTNYYETMPASDENLEFGIQLEAVGLVNSYIKREDLISEMTVVRNEFEAGENDPTSILSQRMLATAYEWHNYGKSTIGNRSDIERVPIENLRDFYQKYYQPDNAMLVIAGQFDEQKALEYIVQYFGVLKKSPNPLPNTYTDEPAQDGERRVTLRRVGTVGAVGTVYHIPAAAHPDFAAVQVLEDTLTSSPSGRLYKALVESKKASSLSGTAFAWHDPGVIQIIASCQPANLDDVRETMIRTTENLAETPITEEEVERSKRRFLSYFEQLNTQSDRLAVSLSNWAGAGDWRLFFLHRDRIEQVTAEDVNRAAQTYLTQSNRTVGVFVPTEEPQRAHVPETPDVEALLKDYAGKAEVARGEAFDPTPQNIQDHLIGGTISDKVEFSLLPKKTRGEMVNVQINLHFGNADSLKGFRTACNLVGPMLRRGTAHHTRQELEDEFDKLQAQVNVYSGVGQLGVDVQVKRENLLPTLKLVKEMLREPTFPKDEFEILKRQRLERTKRQLTQPQSLASTALRRTLNPYPRDDVRYVPTIEEEIGELSDLTLARVKELYEKQIAGEVGEIAGVGDFDPKQLQAALTDMLAGWKADVKYEHIPRVAKPRKEGSRQEILTPDKANAVYIAGQVYELTEADPDYAAMAVGNYLLGSAPLASRLSNRVRGEDGLSYGVGSIASAGTRDDFGQFLIFAITNPKNIKKVDSAIAEEVDKFLKSGVSLAELEQGKAAYLEMLKTQRADDANLTQQLATNLYAGRTYEYYAELEKRIQKLTPEEIRKTFSKYVNPKQLTIIEAGDFQKSEEE